MATVSPQLLPSLLKYEKATPVDPTSAKPGPDSISKSSTTKGTAALTDEILNTILPPRFAPEFIFHLFYVSPFSNILLPASREFEDGGVKYIQRVSSTPATRKDVETLTVCCQPSPCLTCLLGRIK